MSITLRYYFFTFYRTLVHLILSTTVGSHHIIVDIKPHEVFPYQHPQGLECPYLIKQ
jgi:hypothetical protein